MCCATLPAAWLPPDLLLVLGLLMYELQLLRCHWHFCYCKSWTSTKHCGKLKSVKSFKCKTSFLAYYGFQISTLYSLAMKTKTNAKKCQSNERTLQTKFSESHTFGKQTSIKCAPCCGVNESFRQEKRRCGRGGGDGGGPASVPD